MFNFTFNKSSTNFVHNGIYFSPKLFLNKIKKQSICAILRYHCLKFDVSHARPSCSPSPVVAHDGWTYQFLSRILVSPSFSCISCGFIAVEQVYGKYVNKKLNDKIKHKRIEYKPLVKSCLLAKINIIASLISRSLIIRCNSCLASSIRSRSAQSTTKIKPCVPV